MVIKEKIVVTIGGSKLHFKSNGKALCNVSGWSPRKTSDASQVDCVRCRQKLKSIELQKEMPAEAIDT